MNCDRVAQESWNGHIGRARQYVSVAIPRGPPEDSGIVIKARMPLKADQLERPFDKLRKSLKKATKQPLPEQVHDIRTRTRRVEATLHALLLDQKRIGKEVLDAVTPVRKRAGKVRDMDVLMGFAASVSGDGDRQCLVQLLEHLGERRVQGARKLYKTTAKQQSKANQALKRCSRLLEQNYNRKEGQMEWPADTAAVALQLSKELANWPTLKQTNLHPFRLKVKELRYVLQLSGENDGLSKALGEVKDKAGEWHDWTELSTIAQDLLQHSNRCDVLEQIRTGAQERFREALKAANRLRQQYFAGPGVKSKRSGKRLKQLKEPVVEAAATLAA